MIRFAFVLASTGLAATGLIAAQPASTQLAPHGKWSVDYGENLCTLMRSFGPRGEVTLALRPMTGGSQVKLAVVTDDRSQRIVTGKARLELGIDETRELDYYTMIAPKSAQRVLMIQADRKDLKNLDTADTLRVRAVEQPERRFAIEGMGEALVALDACERDLTKRWGGDPDAIAVQPRPIDQGVWFRPDDYSDAALLQRDAAETAVRLNVDARGRASDCMVIAASGSKALDDQLCQVMLRRAKFEPAHDKAGAAVPSVWSTSVSWIS
jgi:TonB family protein